MEAGLVSFRKASPDPGLIDEIFAYDSRTLGQTNSQQVSQYIIALSQYLIYFKTKFNETKMFLTRNTRNLELKIIELTTDEDLKRFKTKKDLRFYVIHNKPELIEIRNNIEILQDEILLLEGIDKTISELIASFKRELTRRENELYQQRNS